MQRMSVLACALLAATAAVIGDARGDDAVPYSQVVSSTANMVSDPQAQALAAKYGLQVMNVTWEDTGRFKGSAVGPNISDMTIQVAQKDPRTGQLLLTCMPVIRFPNFEDKTGDLPIDRFQVLAGNERGQGLRPVGLRELLSNLRHFLSDPLSWKGKGTSLLAERDTHVLVSAQACFLPVPQEGKAEFNPVLFNYQSCKDNPAVLTILVTRQGTSVTIIDNTRDGFAEGGAWGQRLFFNQAGQRASLTGERLSDFVRTGEATAPNPVAVGGEKDAPSAGLNQVLLIQVPLKQKTPPPMMAFGACAEDCEAAPPVATRGRSDVEEAVIGHGAVEGPFTELDGLEIERDERFPIRVTVQFYKATSNGVVSAADLETIAGQIGSVYADATSVGSLVTQGETGRVTEHQGPKVEYPGWWSEFWTRYEKNTGHSRAEALRRLRALTGEGWVPPTEAKLTEALDRAPATVEETGLRGGVPHAPTHMECGMAHLERNAPPRTASAGVATGAIGLLAAGLALLGLRWLS